MQASTVCFDVTYVKAMRRTEALRLIVDLDDRVVAATKRGGKTRHFPCASFSKVDASSGAQAERKFVLNTVIRHANGKRSKKVYWFQTQQERASFCKLVRMLNEYGLQAKEMYTQLNANRTGHVGVEDLQATCGALKISTTRVDLQTMLSLVRENQGSDGIIFREFFRFYATIPNLEIDKLMGHWLSLARQAQSTASGSVPKANSHSPYAAAPPESPATPPKPLLTNAVKEDWFEKKIPEGGDASPLPLLPGEEVLLTRKEVAYGPSPGGPSPGGKGMGGAGMGQLWVTSYRVAYRQHRTPAECSIAAAAAGSVNRYPRGPLPRSFAQVDVPLFSVEAVEASGDDRVQLQCKDCRCCIFAFHESPKWIQSLVSRLRKLCFGGVDSAFAFVYRLELPRADMDGWAVYDPMAEFQRQGLPFGGGSPWQLYGDGHQIASTYPVQTPSRPHARTHARTHSRTHALPPTLPSHALPPTLPSPRR
jgi:hypothetical protein